MSNDKYLKKIDIVKAKLRAECEKVIKSCQKNIKFDEKLIAEGYLALSTSVSAYLEGCYYNSVAVSPYVRKPQQSSFKVASKKIDFYIIALKKINSDQKTFSSELTNLMEQLKTDKRILENLPNLKKYFPTKSVAERGLIPIGQIEAINKKLSFKS